MKTFSTTTSDSTTTSGSNSMISSFTTFDSIQEHANQRIRDNDKKLGHFTINRKQKVCTKNNMLEELADFHAYGFHSIGINYKTKASIQLIREALHYAKKAYDKINLLNK